MNGILPAIAIVLGCLMIAMAIIVALTERERRKLMRENKQLEQERDKLNAENEDLHQSNIAWAEQNTHLHAQNADLREAVQEAQAEIKALNMRTIEIEEVKPERKPIRRNMSKKAGTQ